MHTAPVVCVCVCCHDLTFPNSACFRLVKLLSLERAMDTVVWQLLASVICPGRHHVLSAGSQFCMHASLCMHAVPMHMHMPM